MAETRVVVGSLGNDARMEFDLGRSVEDAVRRSAHVLPLGAASGGVESVLLAERELAVRHDYDTVDRDLERLGMTLSVCRAKRASSGG